MSLLRENVFFARNLNENSIKLFVETRRWCVEKRKENIEYLTRTLLVVPKAQLKSGVVLLFNVNERICVACLDLSDFRLPASDQLFLLSGRLLLAYHQ